MKFKKFLEDFKKSDTSKDISKEKELSPDEKELDQIISLRIDLKNAKTDAQADAIQAKIDKLLNDKKVQLKQTKDNVKDIKTKD